MLVAFLLGTVAQVATASMMPMDMSGAAHAQMNGTPCEGCDEGPDGAAECGSACVAAQLVALPIEWEDPVTGVSERYSYAERTFQDWATPPAQTPPRTRFLM